MNKTYNRDFGVLVSVFIFFFFVRDFYINSNINYYLLLGFVSVLIISFTRPKWFFVPSFIWFKFSVFLSAIVSPLILFFFFYFFISPLSFIIKIFQKDLLKTNFFIKKETNWINREVKPESMKKQY